MDESDKNKPHIYLGANGKAEPFTSPKGGSGKLLFPARDRGAHGQLLLQQLDLAAVDLAERLRRREEAGVEDQDASLLTFASDPGFPLPLDKLEDQRAGVELQSLRQVEGRVEATVRVPHGKLAAFVRKVEDYLNQSKATLTGKPKNQPLVESIASIRSTALEQLWTDELGPVPEPGEAIWWEVWLRGSKQASAPLKAFLVHAAKLGLVVRDGALTMLDRTVVLAFGSREAMATSVELLDCIAELRRAKENPEDFLDLPPAEQAAWAKDLLARITPPSNDAPAVCLLDTGANAGHPLLVPALDPKDCLTVDPTWGTDDHHSQGHGTAMAGVAIYGCELADLLASNRPVPMSHRVESVKLLPRHGQNPPELLGLRTQEAVYRAEVNAPHRRRSICTTVTYPEGRDRGRPTSWSTAIDDLASGAGDDQQRLIVLSAGNVPQDRWASYPSCCHMESIHDPGQAWNALTVGAFTDHTQLDPKQYPGWKTVAPAGALSPCSTTSLVWEKKLWPLKPDVVLEGGNAAIDPASGLADKVESLGILTTYHLPIGRLFAVTGETSAASAQAGRLAAMIQAEYPSYWPETVRALIVHSAEWTKLMRTEFPPTDTQNRQALLRCYGFGVPSLQRALWSAANHLTLIVEDTLQPFRQDGSAIKSGEMKLHSLPWPREALLALAETPVELRVTLSYFVEPNPGRRGWRSRHTYPSCGLRFDLLRPHELEDSFRKRLNKAARDEEEDDSTWASASDEGWEIGHQERFRGSIHSDRWSGIAADLAVRHLVGVYPVSGWWKTRKAIGRWNRPVRYSLVVSIHTPAEAMDIYTPVAVSIPVAVTT